MKDDFLRRIFGKTFCLLKTSDCVLFHLHLSSDLEISVLKSHHRFFFVNMLRNSSKIYLICLKLRVFFNDFYKKQINFRNFWVNKQIWAHAALWGHKSVSLRPCSEIHTPRSHSVRFNFAQEENWWRPHAFCIVKKSFTCQQAALPNPSELQRAIEALNTPLVSIHPKLTLQPRCGAPARSGANRCEPVLKAPPPPPPLHPPAAFFLCIHRQD